MTTAISTLLLPTLDELDQIMVDVESTWRDRALLFVRTVRLPTLRDSHGYTMHDGADQTETVAQLRSPKRREVTVTGQAVQVDVEILLPLRLTPQLVDQVVVTWRNRRLLEHPEGYRVLGLEQGLSCWIVQCQRFGAALRQVE